MGERGNWIELQSFETIEGVLDFCTTYPFDGFRSTGMIKRIEITLEPKVGVHPDAVDEALAAGAELYKAVHGGGHQALEVKRTAYAALRKHVDMMMRNLVVEPTVLQVENAIGVYHDALGL